MKRSALALGLLVLWALPSLAAAQTSVIVLGIRSVEGDDALASDMTGELRYVAGQVDGWENSSVTVSLAQMSLVHDCAEPDAQCMAAIAGDLGVQRILYGTIRRTGAGEQYNFALTLYIFNAETGQIEDSLTDTIPRIATDVDQLRPRVGRYIAQFAGLARYGSMRLVTGQPGATVRIDGEAAGVSDDQGVLLIEDLPQGERQVRIELDGYESFEGSVEVVADEQTEYRAHLAQEQGMDLGWIPGAATLAVGAGFAIPWITNWASTRDFNDQHDAGIAQAPTTDYGRLFAVSVREDGDPCEAIDQIASRGDLSATEAAGARQACEDSDAAHRNQFIFGAISGALLATGTVLLVRHFLSGGDEDGEAEQSRLVVVPIATQNTAGVGAHVTF